MRLATTVTLDAAGNTRATVQAQSSPQVERFNAESVASSRALADSLTRLMKNITDVARAVFAQRRVETITFENITCSAAGALVTLEHRLGRPARWGVVEWSGSSVVAGHSFVRDAASTDNALVLRSYVAGTADIEVF